MNKRNVAVARACVSGSAFLVLCVCVALDLTQTLDGWGLTVGAAFSSSFWAVSGELLSLLGEASLTSAFTLTLAFYAWYRHERYIVAPVLFVVGVGIEIVLKYSLPHPGPPTVVSRPLHPLPFFELPSVLVAHCSLPYSFPSGHMLRTTFLVRLISEQQPRWRLWGWVLVALMAVTRVSGNEHWVSDILGGVLLGWTLAVVALTQDRGIGYEYSPGSPVLQDTTFVKSWSDNVPQSFLRIALPDSSEDHVPERASQQEKRTQVW